MDTEIKDVIEKKYDIKFVKPMLLLATFIATGILTGIYCVIFEPVSGKTYLWTFVLFILGGLGLGPGAHRYFCHRSYKTNRVIKIFMIFCQQLSGVKSVHTWVRVHRTHHKFSDTDRDPVNINRGFFHAAIGWFLIEQTPECAIELAKIHMDDITSDDDLNFQYKHYSILYALITIILPVIIPYYYWNESLLVGFGLNMIRHGLNIYQQIVGNSFLHMNGRKPYDGSYTAIDNDFYNIVTLGEGYHNFHHAFPFDYRANELFGLAHITSLSNLYINVLAAFGLVYDRKFASPQMIARRVTRTGDGSHPLSKKYLNDSKSWGNGDIAVDSNDNE
ncbi:delta(9)-fatty-acid desaturase fat-6-like [Chironomus tepperi]|uniref:delta(9)-fatty-acid desaturase fat-6-like n=1 Tax=Chironomus tepperi TaxID=113505 RepID=UPI00391FB44A